MDSVVINLEIIDTSASSLSLVPGIMQASGMKRTKEPLGNILAPGWSETRKGLHKVDFTVWRGLKLHLPAVCNPRRQS